MRPSDISNSLRKIASGLDNSRFPNKSAVVRDVKRVLAALRVSEEVTSRKAYHFKCEECRKDKDKVETDVIVYSARKPSSPSCPLCKKGMSGGYVVNSSQIMALTKEQKAGEINTDEEQD